MNETPGKSAENRDDVATLVRLAGKRKAVPAERAARVKAAARSQWQEQVSLRSRRRLWAGVGGAVAAALLLVLAGLKILAPGESVMEAPGVNVVETVSGGVWTAAGGTVARKPLMAGDVITTGSEISTDARGRAAIRMATGHLLRFDTSTVIHLQEDGSIKLGQGAVYVDSGFDSVTAGHVDVHTPFGVVREIGTQFEVRVSEYNLRVRLREGVVTVSRGEDQHEMRAGTELVMKADGSVSQNTISIHGSQWSWISTITPVADFEGRTVSSFLEWAARERGWRLAFADDDVAAIARRSVLSGNASQMTLEQALDAALSTSLMTWEVDEGVLRVREQSGNLPPYR